MSIEVSLKKPKVKLNLKDKAFNRNICLVILDLMLINLAAVISLALRFDFQIPGKYMNLYLYNSAFITIIMLISYYLFNLYKSLWRYASIDELISVVLSSFVGELVLFGVFYILKIPFPRSFYFLHFLTSVTLIGGARFTYRAYRRIKIYYKKEDKERKNVLIVGGGKAGLMLIQELERNPQIHRKPIGVIDDDPAKSKRSIHGIPILGSRKDIKRIVEVKKIDEILIAMPTVNKQELKKIIDICKETKAKLKILPGVFELIDGQVAVKKLRDVEIEDLLGRDPIELDLREISGYLRGQVVLVTGGGGSIGSELCRQIAKFNPKELLILDIYENNAYDLQNELKYNYSKLNIKVLIASVRDKRRLEKIFDEFRPEVVFHAAAHKHVPLMEYNPTEAIKNNVFGTLNTAECADKFEAKKFVLISTDKAVNPTNIMGASKRICEMVVQAMQNESRTEFVAVRFGNVLGSNGSVIPLFKKQIANGGPVTLTNKYITRYFMTIPEASQLVMQAGAYAEGGEIFVLDMGKPVKIYDLACDLIRLSGFEPHKDIKIEITGLRPGEKLYEELLMAEEGLGNTKHEKIFVGRPTFTDMKALKQGFDELRFIIENGSKEELLKKVEELVPTYKRTPKDKVIATSEEEIASEQVAAANDDENEAIVC